MTNTAEDFDNPFEAAGLGIFQFARMLRDNPLNDYRDRPEPSLWMYDHHRNCRSGDGNVIRFTRPALSMHGQATVIGDLDAPECDALLNSPAVVGVTDRAPRVMGDRWVRFAGTWADVVNMMTAHPERADKGGHAMFFAASEPTGKTVRNDGQTFQYMYKLKNKLRTVYAVAIDVDGGCSVEPVIARLRELGVFAVVYTTHSHTTKGGPGSDRFRVIIPLAEPFEFGEDWNARYAEWQSRYIGLCEHLIPGEIDARGRLPSQLMYMPARPEGAEFKHFILAGRGLSLDDMPVGDVAKYTRRAPSGAKGGSGGVQGEPAFLSDGFDLLAWWHDHGSYFLLRDFLEVLGWDVLGDAGEGFDITCPNAGAHSDGTGETAWAIDGPDADSGVTVFCHHDHCDGIYTCDFLRLIEEQIELPDDCQSFSALLCDPLFYPGEVDGEPVTVDRADYVDEEIKIDWLKTPAAVGRAFKALPANAGADHLAAIYAGICKAGEGGKAVAKWGEMAKAHLDSNRRKAAERRGREMLDAEKAAYAAEKVEERHAAYADALEGEPDNVSLDPAEPLGDDMETALATLGHRYAPCDLGGHFRIVRKPDLNAFSSEFDSTIAVYRKDDFLHLHLDRQIMEGDKLVNPAQTFLETAKRKSGLVFAPPPTVPGANDFNMYQGRKLKGVPGKYGDERDFPVLYDFLLRIVCDGSKEKLQWLMLWMAHMVQRPGEKPGTGVIAVGEGGIGKGRFGVLLGKLAAPHFKQLENENHVIGQFAGEHLSKCVLVVVNEAVFGANPKVSSTLKALVDSISIQVEVKGFSLVTVPSYTRFYFDSNDAVPVLIELNGSERRYFVLRFNPAKKGEAAFFDTVTSAIEGEEMAMLLAYLERYDPASAGLTWADVRTAPETPERKVMGWHSMRPAVRRLLTMLREREATLRVAGYDETFSAGKDGLRLPIAACRSYIEAAGNKHNAEDSDVVAMVERLFGVEIAEKRGRCGAHKDMRYWLFPHEVLGENVDKTLLGSE